MLQYWQDILTEFLFRFSFIKIKEKIAGKSQFKNSYFIFTSVPYYEYLPSLLFVFFVAFKGKYTPILLIFQTECWIINGKITLVLCNRMFLLLFSIISKL